MTLEPDWGQEKKTAAPQGRATVALVVVVVCVLAAALLPIGRMRRTDRSKARVVASDRPEPRVSVTIDDLLANTRDFDVANGAFMRLVKASEAVGAEASREPELVIVLTWEAHGLIGNGGFECLYESAMLEEDAGFAKTIAAFETLGLDEVSKAFRSTLSWFPPPGPPSDPWKRSELVHARPREERERAYEQTRSGRKALPQKLAAYVRAHKTEIEAILTDYEERRLGLARVDLRGAVSWNVGDRPAEEFMPELLVKLAALPPGGVLELIARHPGKRLSSGDPNGPVDITTEAVLRQFCGNAGHVVLRVEPPHYWIRRRA